MGLRKFVYLDPGKYLSLEISTANLAVEYAKSINLNAQAAF